MLQAGLEVGILGSASSSVRARHSFSTFSVTSSLNQIGIMVTNALFATMNIRWLKT